MTTPETLRAELPRRAEATTDADRATVADLHERRGAEMYGFARHLGLAPEEASDATQEALLRLWAALDAGAMVSSPEPWLFRTLYRICMDQHRWRRRVQGLAARLAPGPETTRVDRDDAIAVWDAVERLPERQRLAVYLRYRADLPYGEIGAVLGIAPVSARSHVSRALDTLRDELGEEGFR